MNTDELIWQDDPEFLSNEERAGNRLDDVYDWVSDLTELPGREAFDEKLAPIADEVILDGEGKCEYRIGHNIFGYKE